MTRAASRKRSRSARRCWDEGEAGILDQLRLGPLSEPLTGRHWEESEIRARINRRAELYRVRGCPVGTRVFLHYGNSLEFFVDLLAIWSVGGTAVPIDFRMTDFEVETLAGAGRPGFSVWEQDPSPALAGRLEGAGVTLLSSTEAMEPGGSAEYRPAPITPEQDALILFTSGTTGQPKGVVHTYGSLAARWQALRRHLGVAEHRRTLCMLPTHFGHGDLPGS